MKREELFITTKLWITEWKPEDVEKSVKICLEELQLDYIDLFLVHQSVLMNLPKDLDEKRRKGYFFDRPLIPEDDPKYRLGYNIDNLKQRSCAARDFFTPSVSPTSLESALRTCFPSVP